MNTSIKNIIILACFLTMISCSGSLDRKFDDWYTVWDHESSNYSIFDNTPAEELAFAVRHGDTETIDRILDENPSLVNYQEPKYGTTLLMMTICNQNRREWPMSMLFDDPFCGPPNPKQRKSFCCLLDHHADPNIIDYYDGYTALLHACYSRDADIRYVRKLIEHGADVNYIQPDSFDIDNYTALLHAASNDRADIVQLLTKNGADINFENSYFRSALSESLRLYYYDIISLLVKNNIDCSRRILQIRPNKETGGDDSLYITISDRLHHDTWPLESEQHKQKMKLVKILKEKGLDYRTENIPACVVEYAKKEYPQSWKEYLEKY